MGIFRQKDNLLEWKFVYCDFFVNIQTKTSEKEVSENLIIASYLLFLARYFYICDDRQTDIVRDALLDYLKNFKNSTELSNKLFNVVFQALSEGEQKATIGLFKSVLPMPTYPFAYSEEQEEPRHSYAKYSFLVFKQGNSIVANFYMSMGPDKILLPLTVGVLYAYVKDKISKEGKEILDKSMIDLLKAHDSVDCRSSDGLRKLPLEIISKNILNEK